MKYIILFLTMVIPSTVFTMHSSIPSSAPIALEIKVCSQEGTLTSFELPTDIWVRIIAISSCKNLFHHVCKYFYYTASWANRENILATESSYANRDVLSYIVEKKDWILNLSYRDAKTILFEQLSTLQLSSFALLIARYIKHRFKCNPMKLGLPNNSGWKYIFSLNRTFENPIYEKLCILFKKPLDIPEQKYDMDYSLVGLAYHEFSQQLKSKFDQLKMEHDLSIGINIKEICGKALKYVKNTTDLQLLTEMNLDTTSMQTALYNAIEADQEASVVHLLSIKDLNFKETEGDAPAKQESTCRPLLDINDVHPLFGTALNHAARYGKTKIIEALLTLGANPMTTGQYGFLPFYEAYANQHTDAAEILEKQMSDPAQIEAIKLYVSCQNGDIKTIQANLDKEHLFESLAMAPKTTFLHIAAYHGQDQLLQMLIDSKYKEVSTLDGKNVTPIVKATQKGHVECFKILHNAGATLTDKDQYGNSILRLAVKNNHLNIVQYLVEVGTSLIDDPALLIWAATKGKKTRPLIKYLIKDKVPVNHETEITTQNGTKVQFTPLRNAIFSGNSGAIQELFNHNANINYNINGKDAFIDACLNGKVKIVELIKRYIPFTNEIGIDCCQRVMNRTEMHLNNKLAILQTLLNYGTPITPELIELAKNTATEVEWLIKRVQKERLEQEPVEKAASQQHTTHH